MATCQASQARLMPNHAPTHLMRHAAVSPTRHLYKGSVDKATSNLIAKLQTPLAKRALSDNLSKCVQSNPRWLQAQSFCPADVHPRLAEQHCAFQFQREHVGYSIGRLDDLYGSLGNFTLYAMPARVQLSPLNSRSCKARVEGVLLYARDTFDFVGDQYLGHWG
ncbi:MAG TPA: DUF6402 family protein, partial [Limnobacter sp.]|nr:DUF6402 family protein [Limnobacter sp.]